MVTFRRHRLLRSDRNLYIVDRLRNMIITGGENVYPGEVEEALYAREEVQEYEVARLPDKEWGERVTIFIPPRQGKTIIPEELKSFLKVCLSAFKVPKENFVVSKLPKNPASKILKRELKKAFIDCNG